MRIGKLMCVAACAALLGVAGGCLAVVAAGGAAAGAGAATLYMGKYEQTFAAPLPKVHDAALAVLRAQGLQVQVDKRDSLTAHLETEYADGKHVWVDLLAQPQDHTKVTVRVGLLPDTERELAILDGIKKKL
jgi:Protein of unknown function (DUF3568)